MYNDFARIYDKLQDIDYTLFVNYIERAFDKYGVKPKLVLDLACGTGNITIPLAKRGYDMIGIDLSIEMLNVAREKAEEDGLNILFLNQDMTDFELYGTVDAIVCMLDSVNYITSDEDIIRFFKLVKNYLNPNGILLFDTNSEYKLKEVLGNNTFVNEEEGIYYVWQNFFDEKLEVCTFELNFFEKQKGDTYLRFDEYHEERVYKPEKIKKLVEEVGLEYLGCFENFSFNNAKEKSERNFFLIRKKNG